MGESSERVLLVSSDGHAGTPVMEYRPYLEQRYQTDFDAAVAEQAALDERRMEELSEASADAGEALAKNLARMAELRFYEPKARLGELESNGVVAEVLFPVPAPSMSMPWAQAIVDNKPNPTARELELKAAGERAYNRWLADFCNEVPGRFIGLMYLPWNDVDAAVREVHWGKEAGLGGILMPVFNYGVPEYADLYWEPLWAALDETDLSLNVHGGFGFPTVGPTLFQYELWYFTGRPFTHLAMSGAFDRYPNLRVAITEAHAYWIPDMLDRLDVFIGRARTAEYKGRAPLPLPELSPREYWSSRGSAGVSITELDDFERREEIGVANMMYGIDYPHPEGSWGQAVTWLQASIGRAGLAEDEARAILGGNAVNFYRLDADVLAPVVQEVGPSITEVLTGASEQQIDDLMADFDEQGRGFNVVNYEGGRDYHTRGSKYFAEKGVR